MSKFEIYQGEDTQEQCWRWRLFDDNNANIGRSEEAFLKGSIKPSVKKIKGNIQEAPIAKDESDEDKDKGYRFEYFKSEKDEQWYWRLKAGNHEIMAISGEGFSSEKIVIEQINLFKKVAADAAINWENEQDDPAYQEKHEDRTEPRGNPGS